MASVIDRNIAQCYLGHVLIFMQNDNLKEQITQLQQQLAQHRHLKCVFVLQIMVASLSYLLITVQ